VIKRDQTWSKNILCECFNSWHSVNPWLQTGVALYSGGRGRKFKSSHPDQLFPFQINYLQCPQVGHCLLRDFLCGRFAGVFSWHLQQPLEGQLPAAFRRARQRLQAIEPAPATSSALWYALTCGPKDPVDLRSWSRQHGGDDRTCVSYAELGITSIIPSKPVRSGGALALRPVRGELLFCCINQCVSDVSAYAVFAPYDQKQLEF